MYKNYVSIICSVYNSHKIFQQQMIYLARVLKGLDDKVEVIFIDDGSEPPLTQIYSDCIIETTKHQFNNFKLLYTYSKKPWNQPAGRNLGARYAKGNYLLMFDLDHIISRNAVIELLNFQDDMMKWLRMTAVLINGKLNWDKRKLIHEYGFKPWLKNVKSGCPNMFGIQKDIFNTLRGYDEKFCGKYGGDDTDFFRRFRKAGGTVTNGEALVYIYPNPRINNDFHNLHRYAKEVGRGNETKV